jgi:ribosomal-protein-serine acetyltransferase
VRIRVREDLELRSVAPADATALDALIAADRERLARFMPWAAGQTVHSTREFIAAALEQEAAENGFQAVVVADGEVAGTVGFHRIDRHNLTTSIGYWLAARYEGRGLMSAAVEALIAHAFEAWGLHRVELRIAPQNERSRALAARLGFTEEGVLRGAERFGDEHRDLIMHSLLAPEWRARDEG